MKEEREWAQYVRGRKKERMAEWKEWESGKGE